MVAAGAAGNGMGDLLGEGVLDPGDDIAAGLFPENAVEADVAKKDVHSVRGILLVLQAYGGTVGESVS